MKNGTRVIYTDLEQFSMEWKYRPVKGQYKTILVFLFICNGHCFRSNYLRYKYNIIVLKRLICKNEFSIFSYF
jgi:hypothetical protein